MLLELYRRSRVAVRRATGQEPPVDVTLELPLEYHGNDYCGWSIPAGALHAASTVVDVGIGEDISFSTSLITRYGCTVHGFDPTPRAIEYVRRLAPEHFVLHEYGVAAEPGTATFYLPNDSRHVSGSLQPARHLGATRIEVRLAGMRDVFDLVGAPRIDLLKIDIEGAEYGLLDSDAFRDSASRIDRLCVEFHHRWPEFGSRATLDAVAGLGRLGFRCAWRSKSTNEEFLFVRPANA